MKALFLFCCLHLGFSFAQTLASDPAFGSVERGMVRPLERTFNDSATLVIGVTSPFDQAVDVVVVGPNGMNESLEVEGERVLEGLLPGRYLIAATDDDLPLVVGTVVLQAKTRTPVSVTLNEVVLDPLDGDLHEPYGNNEFGPGGVIEQGQGSVIQIERGLAGSEERDITVLVVGPDDYRETLDSDNTVIELVPSRYLVVATAEGYEMTGELFEAPEGEVVRLDLLLEPLAEGEQP